jgi:hypothetical protein
MNADEERDRQNSEEGLALIEQVVTGADVGRATGLVVEVRTAQGFVQEVGPFDKNTAEAFAFIEQQQSEEDPEAEANTYTVHLLFAPTTSRLQSLLS